MSRKNSSKASRDNKNYSIATASLVLLTITQIPIALNSAAQLACIGEVSNQLWKKTNSHQGVNIAAVRSCYGGP